MKASLKTQLGQQLSLTPQLLQSIRLLQLSGLELELELRQALEDNPLLELEDEPGHDDEPPEAMPEHEAEPSDVAVDIEEADLDYESAEWGSGAGASSDEDPFARQAAPETTDLRSHLLGQYALERHEPAELPVADFLIDHLDDSGYLPLGPAALAAEAEAHGGIDGSRLEAVRQRLMRLDPPGIGARDLRECLRVQLQAMPAGSPGLALARRLVDDHLECLAEPDEGAVAAALGVPAAAAAEARALVLSLQPRPASTVAQAAVGYVVPDVLVQRQEGGWTVSLNPASCPRIRINPVYERMLGEGGEAGGMREMLSQARWLTRGLAMRFDTLLRATRAIVERQHGFLEHGEEAMLPLNLKEIAEVIGMHESTISRIANGKFVQTPRGTFELKRFFPVKLEGAAVAGSAVKAMVRKLIDGEPPGSPLADDQVVTLLAHQGVRIARRTVAKYRDQMRIPPAKERARRHTGRNPLARSGLATGG